VLGTSRATLWIASTAIDTDFQVSIGDVWPNGDVEYVQKGWLRASHRKLVGADDVNASPSVYRPVHTDRASDAELLVPGRATKIDVEIPPVGQAFRAGHRIRRVAVCHQGDMDHYGCRLAVRSSLYWLLSLFTPELAPEI